MLGGVSFSSSIPEPHCASPMSYMILLGRPHSPSGAAADAAGNPARQVHWTPRRLCSAARWWPR